MQTIKLELHTIFEVFRFNSLEAISLRVNDMQSKTSHYKDLIFNILGTEH